MVVQGPPVCWTTTHCDPEEISLAIQVDWKVYTLDCCLCRFHIVQQVLVRVHSLAWPSITVPHTGWGQLVLSMETSKLSAATESRHKYTYLFNISSFSYAKPEWQHLWWTQPLLNTTQEPTFLLHKMMNKSALNISISSTPQSQCEVPMLTQGTIVQE